MKIPTITEEVFDKAYNKAREQTDSDAKAIAIAWGVVKNRLTKVEDKMVALSENFKPIEYYTFELNAHDNKLVINATGDELTFEGVLASTDTFQQDAFTVRKYSEDALKDMAEQINKFGSSHPDIDHETMNTLVNQYGRNYELIMNALPKKKGIIKSIQAVYENGKLWIKGVLNPTFRKIMKNVRGISIEALSEDIDLQSSTINKAKYLGFTFAVNKNPKMSVARVTRVSA